MSKVKIFQSNFSEVIQKDKYFRKQKVAEGKSIYGTGTRLSETLIHNSYKRSYVSLRGPELTVVLRTFKKDTRTFNDGSWHVKVNLPGSDYADITTPVGHEYNVNIILELFQELINYPEYDIEVFEYGIFSPHAEKSGEEDIIFNWSQRHLGELWIDEKALEDNPSLKKLVERYAEHVKRLEEIEKMQEI